MQTTSQQGALTGAANDATARAAATTAQATANGALTGNGLSSSAGGNLSAPGTVTSGALMTQALGGAARVLATGYAGSNAGAQIAAAIAAGKAASPQGVEIDALGYSGTQSIGQNIWAGAMNGIIWPNWTGDLLLGDATYTTSVQWVVPGKSTLAGIQAQSNTAINGTAITAASNFVTYASGCSITLSGTSPNQTATVGGCTSFSTPAGNSGSGTFTSLFPGAFVLIEQTGTTFPDAYQQDTFLAAWEVTALTTGNGGFQFAYHGSLTPSGTYTITIPLVWWGSQTQATNIDAGAIIRNLTVNCSDAPNSIGIFTGTVNEFSRLEHLLIRQCTRRGWTIQANANGVPANSGPDEDVSVYMSNYAPTGPYNPPAANNIDLVAGALIDTGGLPYRGISGGTYKMLATPNPVMDAIEIEAVDGAEISNIHSEQIDHIVHFLNPQLSVNKTSSSIFLYNLSGGIGSYPYSLTAGSYTDNCGHTYTTATSGVTAGLNGAAIRVDNPSLSPGALHITAVAITRGGGYCTIDDQPVGFGSSTSGEIVDNYVELYLSTGSSGCIFGSTVNPCVLTGEMDLVNEPFVVRDGSSTKQGYWLWDSTNSQVDVSGNGKPVCLQPNGKAATPGQICAQTGGYETSPVGTTVASASTIAITGSVFHVTGTTAIATISVPAGMSSSFGGCVSVVADGAWTTTTSGNISNAMTATAGQMYRACYDGVKWYVK